MATAPAAGRGLPRARHRDDARPTTSLAGAKPFPRIAATVAQAERILGGTMKDVAPARSLRELGELIRRVSEADEPVALIILSASRLVRDVTQLSDEEFEFYRQVDTVARHSQPVDRAVQRPVAFQSGGVGAGQRTGRAPVVRPSQRSAPLHHAAAARRGRTSCAGGPPDAAAGRPREHRADGSQDTGRANGGHDARRRQPHGGHCPGSGSGAGTHRGRGPLLPGRRHRQPVAGQLPHRQVAYRSRGPG